MKQTERVIPRRLTAEEQARGLAVVENLKRLHQEMLAERNGVPFSPSWELINEERDRRSRGRS